MNDNYCFWDDDMIAGSIHTIPYIEMFYWLKKTGYNNWISTDQYPYREDGRDAVNESVRWMEAYINVINKLDENIVEKIINNGNACEASSLMREILFNGK
jgi:xylose isomerase